ncbi:MAG: MBL fold metallo-hydrolase [Armatimonadetes bacterium]|nr:MBL fold metallo-hydrolase [Armatimonadota bacterium]
MRLTLLGTGTPNAEPDRMGSALAISNGDDLVLIDAGPGVVRRALQAGFAAQQLDTVFLTHLHSDHTAGLADLWLTPPVLGRTGELRLFGPPGVAALGDGLWTAYQADLRERSDGLEPTAVAGFGMDSTEMEPGDSAQIGEIEVTCFASAHGSWPAYGYRVETAAGTVVVSGDTAPYDGIEENYAGAAILVHEVYSSAGLKSRPADWRTYHEAVHTSASELGEIAAQVRPRLLVLTHQLMWGVSEGDLVDEIERWYDGPIVFGEDLDSFEVGELVEEG